MFMGSVLNQTPCLQQNLTVRVKPVIGFGPRFGGPGY
jgi:hypothetical protein